MISLSLCMIVKNEEKTLSRCLDSVKTLVDEFVIVDTGSTDKTKDIAYKYTKNVYDFKWVDDFSKARNFSFSKATCDYVIWLDADDIIADIDIKNLKKLKNELDNSVDIVMLKYNTGFDNEGNVNFLYYRERIVKKTFKWYGQIHETIAPSGNIIYKDIAITHKKESSAYSDRNLKIFNRIIKEGYNLDVRQKFYYARELYFTKKYTKAIKAFKAFFNEDAGFVENKISACLDLSYCYLSLGKKTAAFNALTQSFLYSLPRAEICCAIANLFFEKADYTTSIYWYNRALESTLDISTGGFYNLDYYYFIPHIQLCVCNYNLGNILEAKHQNELAGKYKPSNQLYLQNKAFFNSI